MGRHYLVPPDGNYGARACKMVFDYSRDTAAKNDSVEPFTVQYLRNSDTPEGDYNNLFGYAAQDLACVGGSLGANDLSSKFSREDRDNLKAVIGVADTDGDESVSYIENAAVTIFQDMLDGKVDGRIDSENMQASIDMMKQKPELVKYLLSGIREAHHLDEAAQALYF